MKYGINMTWNDLQKDEGALALVRPGGFEPLAFGVGEL